MGGYAFRFENPGNYSINVTPSHEDISTSPTSQVCTFKIPYTYADLVNLPNAGCGVNGMGSEVLYTVVARELSTGGEKTFTFRKEGTNYIKQ